MYPQTRVLVSNWYSTTTYLCGKLAFEFSTMGDRDNTVQQPRVDNRIVRVEMLATPIPSTKLPFLLDTQTTLVPFAFPPACPERSRRATRHQDPCCTNRNALNSNPLNKTPTSNRNYLHILRKGKLPGRVPEGPHICSPARQCREGKAARPPTSGALPSAALSAQAPMDPGFLLTLNCRLLTRSGEAKAKGEEKPNRYNRKFKNRGNPKQ